jgi:hypothetical protein
MSKNIIYILYFTIAVFLWNFVWLVIALYFTLSYNSAIIIFLSGIAIIIGCLLKVHNSKIKNIYQEVAQKFEGEVNQKSIFSPPQISFKYKGFPTVISYFSSGRYYRSLTFVKVLTNFPKNIKLIICRKVGTDKFLKKLGLEDKEIEIRDKDFNKKFKLELKGIEKDFLNELLTPKIKNGFMYFSMKDPIVILNGGELIFHANGVPLDLKKFENYYGFTFNIVDRIGNLLEKKSTTS